MVFYLQSLLFILIMLNNYNEYTSIFKHKVMHIKANLHLFSDAFFVVWFFVCYLWLIYLAMQWHLTFLAMWRLSKEKQTINIFSKKNKGRERIQLSCTVTSMSFRRGMTSNYLFETYHSSQTYLSKNF